MSSSTPRVAVTLLAVVAVAVVAAGVPFDGADRSTPSTPSETVETRNGTPIESGPSFGDSLGLGRFLFLALLGVLLLGAVLVLYRTLSRTEFDDPASDQRSAEAPAVDLEAVGEAAGRTADRVERYGTLDNEVYRAWSEMTTHLRVANRRSRTPGEFAAAAERAGMDGAAVRELTELFESVRYGDGAPTDADRRRAVELLRHIESAYGGEEE